MTASAVASVALDMLEMASSVTVRKTPPCIGSDCSLKVGVGGSNNKIQGFIQSPPTPPTPVQTVKLREKKYYSCQPQP